MPLWSKGFHANIAVWRQGSTQSSSIQTKAQYVFLSVTRAQAAHLSGPTKRQKRRFYYFYILYKPKSDGPKRVRAAARLFYFQKNMYFYTINSVELRNKRLMVSFFAFFVFFIFFNNFFRIFFHVFSSSIFPSISSHFINTFFLHQDAPFSILLYSGHFSTVLLFFRLFLQYYSIKSLLFFLFHQDSFFHRTF